MSNVCIDNIALGDKIGISIFCDQKNPIPYQEFEVIELSKDGTSPRITIGSQYYCDGFFHPSTGLSSKHYPYPFYKDIFYSDRILKIRKNTKVKES